MKHTELNESTSFHDNLLTIEHFFERSDNVAFLYAVAESFYLRKQVNESVIAFCKEKNKTIGLTELSLDAGIGLLTQLEQAKQKYPGGLILNNIDPLISATDGNFAYELNFMREGLIALGVPLLIWLTKESHTVITQKAFDLYLRRDLSTLFFEDPVIGNTDGSLERFTESTKESIDFEETRMRITLLERQLAEARTDDFSRSRLANEIVLPLIKAYVDCSMLIKAKELLSEFESEFDYNKTDADTVIANLFVLTGNYSQAILHYNKSLSKNLKLFGKNHPIIAYEYNNLGIAARNNGDIDKAIEYYERALDIESKSANSESHIIAVRYNNLGLAWGEKGNLNRAIEYIENALIIDQKLYGEVSAGVAIRYSNLGMAWQDKGNFDKAIFFLEKALEIDLMLFGEFNFSCAIDYNNLGCTWELKENFAKAIEYIEKALKINLKLSGNDSPEVALSYNNLAMAWEKMGKPDVAIDYLEKALNIEIKIFGEESPKIAVRYNNLGYVWRGKGDIDKAILYYEKALEIDFKLSGENSVNVAIRYNNIGRAWQIKGNLDEALMYYEKAYKMLTTLSGDDSPTAKNIKLNYDDCLKQKATIKTQ